MPRALDDLIDEAAANLGVVQQTATVGAGTRTRSDLIVQVLFNLGALGEGNRVPSAEASADVTSAITSIVRLLDAKQIVTITDTNAIDNAYFLPLASIVAEAMKEQYGIDADTPEAAGLVADARQAEADLKTLTRRAVIARNVDQILADLAAREIVYLVDTSSIPDEWFTHLAWIVADRCKAKGFDLDTNRLQNVAQEGAGALMALREMTRGRPSYNTLRTAYM